MKLAFDKYGFAKRLFRDRLRRGGIRETRIPAIMESIERYDAVPDVNVGERNAFVRAANRLLDNLEGD